MIHFKDLLVQARIRKNMTKVQVAKQMGWTPMYYGRYENGYLLPSGLNIKRFAAFIEISESELAEIVDKDKNKVGKNENA